MKNIYSTRLSTLLISGALSSLLACSNSSDEQQSVVKASPASESELNKASIKNSAPPTIKSATDKKHRVKGFVWHKDFEIDQAIFSDGNLVLRMGTDLLTDAEIVIMPTYKVQYENYYFDNELIPEDQWPKILLSVRHNPNELPSEIVFLNDYELQIKFGKSTALGIPFNMRFNINDSEFKSHIEGRYLATFRDVRLLGSSVDVKKDTIDTLDFLARQYITETKEYEDISLQDRFGATFDDFGFEYPKIAFLGFEARDSKNHLILLKFQFLKDQMGWHFERVIDSDQIHQANPISVKVSINKRAIETARAEKSAALKLQEDLKSEGVMSNVRSTSVDCYVTRDFERASCRMVYGFKEKKEGLDNLECKTRSFLMRKVEGQWLYTSAILDTQKVDFNSGALVYFQPFNTLCS